MSPAIAFVTLLAKAPAGTRIEFGVCRGDTLALILAHDGDTYGVDSFEGMAEPGPHDLNEAGISEYPRGRLACPLQQVTRRFSAMGGLHLVQGWIPQVLEQLPHDRYAFAHVDLDHYAPTVAAIAWLWDRMLPGGILCCDDWFEGRACMASRAIGEAEKYRRPLDGMFGRKGFWRF